jgi:hypothetical protein
VQVSAGTGDLSYRFHLTSELPALLHGSPLKWATGLGFLDPTYHQSIGLPGGSIRTSDLGRVDGIILIGVVGVVLTCLMALIPLRLMSMEARSRDLPPSTGWVLFGLILWLVQVLLASYTLGTLWQQPGQVLVAMVGGLGLQLCRLERGSVEDAHRDFRYHVSQRWRRAGPPRESAATGLMRLGIASGEGPRSTPQSGG